MMSNNMHKTIYNILLMALIGHSVAVTQSPFPLLAILMKQNHAGGTRLLPKIEEGNNEDK
jgi:hypothetical protein